MDKDLSKTLREIEKDFAAKKAALETDLHKKKEELLGEAMTEFYQKVREANKALTGFPKEFVVPLTQHPDVKAFLKQLSVTLYKGFPKRKARKGRKSGTARKGRKPAVTEAQILAFVETERTTEDLKKHFGGWSSPTFNKYLNPLIKAGKVSATNTRPKIYKKV